MLAKKICTPCKDASPDYLLKPDTIDGYMTELSDWKLAENGKSIEKNFTFADFLKAMSFIESVADVAQEADHHPDIHIWYNKVKLELSTHAVGGLTENDFIVAARIDQIWVI